jgi:hypothetical protein
MVTYSDYVMEHVTIWEGILYAVFVRHEGDKNACWESDLHFVFYHSINFKQNIPKTSFNGTNA